MAYRSGWDAKDMTLADIVTSESWFGIELPELNGPPPTVFMQMKFEPLPDNSFYPNGTTDPNLNEHYVKPDPQSYDDAYLLWQHATRREEANIMAKKLIARITSPQYMT